MKGDVVGRGRDAEILDHGPGLVLRRPLRPRSTEREAAVMRWVDEHGYPAPRVVDEVEQGIVMERVSGPTMLESLSARSLLGHMRTLAALHARLHRLPAPPGLSTPYGAGAALLHGDLHPGNVILAERGPVVIDWPDACVGPPGADLAEAWLLIACTGLPEGRLARAGDRTLRSVAVAALLSAAERHGEREPARRALADVLRRRRDDPNLSGAELARMERVVARRG